jgi:integrase
MNPLEFFTREDYKTLGGERAERSVEGINILKVSEAEKFLATAEQNPEMGLLPSLVLRLFCGLRTAEVCRVEWQEVRWTEPRPFVHIPASKAKKRRIRLVDLPVNAVAWLRHCTPPAKGLVVPGSGEVRRYCKRFSRLVELAELSDWGKNDTRHSFGSYHYALHGDAVKTSVQMGHKQGDDVLFSNYRQLVTAEDGARFFALMPNSEAGKVVAFSHATA